MFSLSPLAACRCGETVMNAHAAPKVENARQNGRIRPQEHIRPSCSVSRRKRGAVKENRTYSILAFRLKFRSLTEFQKSVAQLPSIYLARKNATRLDGVSLAIFAFGCVL